MGASALSTGLGANKGLFNNTGSRFRTDTSGISKDPNLVTELDADAPLRSKKTLCPEDEEADRIAFKYVFELLRARKYEEALDICEKTGNWSLKVTISGHNDYIDPEIDGGLLSNIDDSEPRGAEAKVLWQYMCRQLARQAQNIDAYERGIYGFLGGDLDSVLKLCDTWETQFIAYMSHLMVCDADAALVSDKRLAPGLAISPSAIKANHSSSSAQKVLDILSNSSNPVVAVQSEHMIRTLMGAVINGTVGYLVEEASGILRQVMTGAQGSSPLTDNPYILRIFVHLILFLQSIDVPVGDAENVSVILCGYIELLRLQNMGTIAPLYIAYLPDDIAIDTYSVLLATITEQDIRKEHLQLGHKYGLDMANTIRAAVERVFSENEHLYDDQEFTDISTTVSESDVKLYQSIEWFIDSNMWPDAVHSMAALYRRFLSAGRVGAAREFGNRISVSYVVKRYDGHMIGSGHSLTKVSTDSQNELAGIERIQVLEFERLLNCINDIAKWDLHVQVPDQSSKPWRMDALAIVDSISSQVYDLCLNWFRQEEFELDQRIQRLRSIYLPYIILELGRVLISAQKVHSGFLKQAAELAVVIADEKQGLYRLFLASNQLESLLTIVATAVTDGMARGESGIFDA
ncbi:Nup84p [Sugiyamaella lignohabitans]|uniref:Nuclear pore complex protein n=1 Tax=Sugiyamaella lignohabitans TaxID=796027 RepID=A0A161HF90_9ASCO|nr:Nup84p [Sugiyamaella lignohabitans]ANB11141.1 Nup84p [Sugiyamaella lignohabitans]